MSEVNNEIYEAYGEKWYTADDDPIALLRAESKAKLPWVLKEIQNLDSNSRQEILDVGCGGGFLSNALAEKGFLVTGIDLSEESLKVAKAHDKTGSINYVPADAYHLPFPDQTFDVVTAMDFLEHVERPEDVVKECARVLRPGGIFIYHTFNRNWLSWLIIIKLVEWLVKNTPKDMHLLRLFIKPKELENFCKMAGLTVHSVTGLRPVISSLTLKSLFTGIVPKTMRFTTTSSLLLSYMGCARKNNLTTLK
jgi:2-polyprenyl-6-hydroxyphenyl methylase/3-demethylubiquinone-9 3-methyltransferase